MTRTLLILKNDKLRLIQLSFLMLFVELTLIRWVGSNVYYLFFFANFILLASFLGIGIGFLRAKHPKNYFRFSPILLAMLIVFTYHFSFQYEPRVDSSTNHLNYSLTYFKNNLYPVWMTLPIIFLMTTAVMATIANEVARTFQKFSPLTAYRFEIIGSLLGISVFTLLSFLTTSPLSWGVMIALFYLALLHHDWSQNIAWLLIQISMLAIILFTFSLEANTPNHLWSPYYKIAVQKYADRSYVVNVNGLAQQIIEPVTQRKQQKPFYFAPYQHSPNALNHVLVIGAGTGGDVAIALAEGAKHIDAVEIDPMLYRLGKKLNPDFPYADPRVRVFIDDGRAFLQQSKDQYDMIIFALTDSLALIPGQSSLRLENYLYTYEGLEIARKHLKPDGIFTIYNYYGARWFVDRLANTLNQIYQYAPCVDSYGAQNDWATVLTISPTKSVLQCLTTWHSSQQAYEKPATDNHPFIYLQEQSIPPIYLVSLIFIAFISLWTMKIMGARYSAIRQYPDLFFMGSAFLLLETKNIINFSLLFGATWFVNALVFIGVLFTVYLAVEITNTFKFKRANLLYLILMLSLLVSWFVPNAFLLSLSFPLRFMFATTLAFLPVLMANLIFADRFSQALHSTEAFGVNFIGAVMGGLLEYSSLILGYQNLLLVIICLYLIAIVCMRFSRVGYLEVSSLRL